MGIFSEKQAVYKQGDIKLKVVGNSALVVTAQLRKHDPMSLLRDEKLLPAKPGPALVWSVLSLVLWLLCVQPSLSSRQSVALEEGSQCSEMFLVVSLLVPCPQRSDCRETALFSGVRTLRMGSVCFRGVSNQKTLCTHTQTR